ncbi:MAG: RNA methyltransferase [Burkholderiales bacterium]
MNSSPALDRVRIVLSHTSHPGNIGAAARAMKTMGLTRLFLVKPRRYPHADAEAFAAGAADVLANATLCESLEQALAGTVFTVGTTARRRDLPQEVRGCRDACTRLASATADGDVALVFGPERSGLTAGDAMRCTLLATIDGNPDYFSLNLAQAVQVFAYELRIATQGEAPPAVPATVPATHEELEALFRHLEQTMLEVGFLNPRQPKKLMQRMRRLISRARLEKEELNILRGFLRAAQRKLD